MDKAHEFADKELKKLERRFAEHYKKANREMQKKLREFLERFDEEDKIMRQMVVDGLMTSKEYDDWKIKRVLLSEQWEETCDNLAKDYTNANRIAAEAIRDSLPSVLAEGCNWTEYGIEKATGVSSMFTLVNKDVVDRLIKDQPDLLPNVKVDARRDTPWNRRKITSAVTQGILQGESMDGIAKRLRSVTDMNKYAAIRNARTAVTGAENAGRAVGYERAKSSGINIKQQWLATLDNRTRHAHRFLDGQVQEIGKPFEVDGYKIKYPGDPDAPAYLIYNCRCTTIAAIEGHEIDLSERDSSLIGSYEEWKRQKTEFNVVDGHDLTGTWTRRPDKFAFAIEDVINAQGFDGKPRIVNAEEFDAYVKKANGGEGFVAQRTYSASSEDILEAYRAQLYNGKWYVDCGTGGAQYGQGMYCAADYTGKLSQGIKDEMTHYQHLGEERFGVSQREYAERLYQEEMAKVKFPIDVKYRDAFTDEFGITNHWIKGSEEQEFIKKWIAKNPKEAQRLKEKFEKAQKIGVEKGMVIERLSKEEFKKQFPDLVAKSYTETITLDKSARIISFDDIVELKNSYPDKIRDAYRIAYLEEHASILGEAGIEFAKRNFGIDGYEFDFVRMNELYANMSDEAKKIANAVGNVVAPDDEVFKYIDMDLGAFAALLGYDAINAIGHGASGSYTVILNRTKLILKRS